MAPVKQSWKCYLIFDRNGVQRMTKGEPGLSSGEFAVRVEIAVPHTLFKRKYPEAVIEVPESAMIEPKVTVLASEEPAP
jgi:hypothetical protein